MYLAGDIGGTKTHLAIFDGDKRVREKKFPSREYESLQTIVQQFLGDEQVDGACFGIAGPVKNNRCVATNLPWVVDAKDFAIPKVSLLNDLEANAYGLRVLSEEEFFAVNPGKGEGNQALISPGTGLGEAGLFFDGKNHTPFATEGGHSDFSPRNEEEIDLLRYLLMQFTHVSFERLLSGPGLYNIYRFLIDTDRETDRDVITNEDGEGPKHVTENALAGNRACERAVELFVSLLGGEAGNVALKFLATGGVYIGGGIVPKIKSLFDTDLFMKEFAGKGRFYDLLKEVPVKIVLNQETALLGAGYWSVTESNR